MRDNIVCLLLGASLTGAVALESQYENKVPQAATFYQEGRAAPQISETALAREEKPEDSRVDGIFSDPGPVSHIVDVGGLGPPEQDDYPRSPSEIREVLQNQRRNFGLLP